MRIDQGGETRLTKAVTFGVFFSFSFANMVLGAASGALPSILGAALPLVGSLVLIMSNGRLICEQFLLWCGTIVGLISAGGIIAGQDFAPETRAFMQTMVVVACMLQLLTSRKSIEIALGALAAAGILLGALMNLNFWSKPMVQVSVQDSWELRQGAEFAGGNPNIAAMNLVLALCAAFYFLFRRQARLRPHVRVLLLAGVTLMVLAMFTTGSRKALLALGVFLAVMALARGVLRAFWIGSLFGLLVLLTVVNDRLFLLIGHRLLGLEGTNESDEIRSRAVEEGLQLFESNPQGVGFGNSWQWLSEVHYTHSNYIEVLVSIGLLGFPFYYGLHVWLLLSGFRGASEARDLTVAFTLTILVLDIWQVTYPHPIPLLILAIACACRAHTAEAETTWISSSPPAPGRENGERAGVKANGLGYAPKTLPRSDR